MNARVRALALGLLLPSMIGSVVLTPVQAFAQDDPAVTAEARKRFLEGVKLFDEKKYELARAAFLQAYALKKHPDVLLNLAQAENLSGKPFEAASHFKEFLKDPQAAQHPKRADAERGLAEARGKIGRIQVTVDAADAEVLLDGKKVGNSPLTEPLDVPPGPHVVEARKGSKSANQGVLAPEGKVTVVSLNIEGGAAAAVVPPPPETKKDEPKKDEPKKDEPKKDEPKKDDDATASVSTEGRESFTHWWKRSPLAWAGTGAAVIGLGMGIGFQLAAKSADSNADDLTKKIKDTASTDQALIAQGRSTNPCREPVATGKVSYAQACAQLQSSLDDGDKDRSLSTVGFVIGALGVGAVVGGYFLTSKKEGEVALDERSDKNRKRVATERPRFVVAPIVGPMMNGLGAAGTF